MAFSTLREEIDWLLAQQKTLLKLGVTPSRLIQAKALLLWLQEKFQLHDLGLEELALRLNRLLIDVLWSIGGDANPRAVAARKLYGSDPATMGLPLKTRRRIAAQKIDVQRSDGSESLTVETWTRLWEPGIRIDVAWTLATVNLLTTSKQEQSGESRSGHLRE